MFKSSTWHHGNTARFRRKEGWFDQLGLPSSDRMINLRVTIDMSFRFRFALLLCAFIILVNILFKVQTDFVEKQIYRHSRIAVYHSPSGQSGDQDIERQAIDAVEMDLVDRPGSKYSKMRQHRLRNRLRHAEQQQESAAVEDHAEQQSKLRYSEPHQGGSEEGSCLAGHIPGLGRICDSTGCLRRLQPPSGDAKVTGRETLSEKNKRDIDFLPGWLDPTHYDIIPLVTDIQWTEGVYGSVGEIVAGVGKMTSLLSYNVDQSVGELLFVSDDFTGEHQQQVLNSDQSTYDTFVENISHCGYTVTDITSDQGDKQPVVPPPKDSKTVYVHKGNIMDLDKELFQRWDIPQFRMLALDGGQGSNPISLHSSLIISSCILADGGILIVDGIDLSGPQNHALACLTQYFNHVQGIRPVLVPLLSARNKLYLTTVGFKKKYTEHLTRYAGVRLETGVYETTTNKFGRKFTYLTLED